jgi:nucleotide-binding universal stress UspA family protein
MRIEAVRSQHVAQIFPLGPGDRTWVGVRRLHALEHPGLSFLLVTDGAPEATSAISVGRELARACHARLMLLGCGRDARTVGAELSAARQSLGSGLAGLEVRSSGETPRRAMAHEAARSAFDLAIRGVRRETAVEAARDALDAGEQHVLLVRADRPLPRRALLCVAVGEPGKTDIQFAARLLRHLGAEVKLFTVTDGDDWSMKAGERFLAAGARSLSLLGVATTSGIRTGRPLETILDEARTGGHDLLVLGAPLPGQDGRVPLGGLVGSLLAEIGDIPVLIVQTRGEKRP